MNTNTHTDHAGPPNPPPATRTTVDVNGYALREIRVRSGIDIGPFAEQVGVTRSYLTKIEIGYSQRVSPTVYTAILTALDIRDRRVLLANPHHRASPVMPAHETALAEPGRHPGDRQK